MENNFIKDALLKKGIAFATLILTLSCTSRNSEAPIQFLLVPAQEVQILQENGKKLQDWLSHDLNRAVEVKVPISYSAVIEAFGSKRADVAVMNSFGFLIARERYQAEAHLVALSKGKSEYYGQIIARKNQFKDVQLASGKKFGFVSPSSGSGYVAAMKFLKSKNISVKEQMFLGSHDAVVTAVYQGRVDIGATFYADDEDGQPRDARNLVKTQFPDVFEKIERLALTGPIPNEPVVLRKDLNPELKIAIIQSLKKFIATEEGKKVFHDLYHFDNFADTTNQNYDSLVQDLKMIGQDPSTLVK